VPGGWYEEKTAIIVTVLQVLLPLSNIYVIRYYAQNSRVEQFPFFMVLWFTD
jgi:hypothetical protein